MHFYGINRHMCCYGNLTFCVMLITFITLHYENKPYSNILENLPAKYENFQIKILIFFLCLLKNIDCEYSLEPPRRGGSNEYPQSMF